MRYKQIKIDLMLSAFDNTINGALTVKKQLKPM